MLWDEEVETGLGAELLRTVEAVLAVISRHPKRYPIVFAKARKALVRRFPYGIFYAELEDHVQVIAVYHGRRDPVILKSRIELPEP